MKQLLTLDDQPAYSQRQQMDLLHKMANAGIYNAVRGLSGTVGEYLSIQNPGVRRVALVEIPDLLGGPEAEAVGIYLCVEGDLGGQMMLIIPYAKALKLAHRMMGAEEHDSSQLGQLERSALAEIGNVTGAYFLTGVADALGLSIRPSPPAVMVDMVGAVLDVLLATAAASGEQVLMIQATFTNPDREVEIDFWMLPDPSTLGVKSTPAAIVKEA